MQQEITQTQLELLDFLERDFRELQQNHDRLAGDLENVQSRFPALMFCDGVIFVGEHFEPRHQRLNFQLLNVRSFEKAASTFNVILNSRDGVLDIELHNASEDRVFPLEQFIESGRSDACAYMLLSPYEKRKVDCYLELSEIDQKMLQEILGLILYYVNSGKLERNDLTRTIDVKQWADQITLLKLKFEWLSLNERLLGNKSDAFVEESGILRRLNRKLKRKLSGA